MLEWLKRHAWKACKPLKGFPGSNPGLSAFLHCTYTKDMMKRLIALFAIIGLTLFAQTAVAQETNNHDTLATAADTASMAVGSAVDSLLMEEMSSTDLTMVDEETMEQMGFHKLLKKKFIEGNAGFMSLVALALVLGLAFCIERLIYLTLAEVNSKKLMADIDRCVASGDVESAKAVCRDTRGPVASVCYQGLLRIDEPMDDIERSIMNYGSVQAANLEKGCSWIKLFIAIAPSLGFLGTVIGMVMSFDQIQNAGDISPTIVASGMKVALITTIFGIVVALILQVFYNYILTKIEHLTQQMEESAITLMDIITKQKRTSSHG